MKTFCVVLSALAFGAWAGVATVHADLVSYYTFDSTTANAVNRGPQRHPDRIGRHVPCRQGRQHHQLRRRRLLREHDRQWSAGGQWLGHRDRRLLDEVDDAGRN